MPRIILVRHGKTVWNAEGRYQGKMDIPLNEEGKEQARRVGEALKGFPVKAVYSSPLSRCRDTAAEIAKHHNLEVQVKEGFKEIDHGEWEGLLASEVEKKYPELLKLWRTRPAEVKMPGGESLRDVYDRAVKAFNEVVSSHSDEDLIVIVGHDATNKVLMCHLLGVDLNKFWAFKQANCGITVLEYSPETGNVVVHVANATGHLGKDIDFEVQKSL
ncbi:alpha-ribazole phosphatase [Thermovibrio ammonificans]|jgi:probable phosphoglycerate mutase|uniref:Alpha-ribazole phosphatase n=1 Tax=Thermovibrio ammonificans (strain DSM 15698 / JCM 12110 / HB-1) TaxID=648996 RepID=E8T3P8_THEA1|nr:alpha-ribazole phosphatase [Thermovibrio ammonificans]ADU97305.1 Phosphoglycerate mutase [Thermovibrio ammonificans HB-1]